MENLKEWIDSNFGVGCFLFGSFFIIGWVLLILQSLLSYIFKNNYKFERVSEAILGWWSKGYKFVGYFFVTFLILSIIITYTI